jgi:hypothetical protein
MPIMISAPDYVQGVPQKVPVLHPQPLTASTQTWADGHPVDAVHALPEVHVPCEKQLGPPPTATPTKQFARPPQQALPMGVWQSAPAASGGRLQSWQVLFAGETATNVEPHSAWGLTFVQQGSAPGGHPLSRGVQGGDGGGAGGGGGTGVSCTITQTAFSQAIGWPKRAQQLRVSVQVRPSFLQRQRPFRWWQ